MHNLEMTWNVVEEKPGLYLRRFGETGWQFWNNFPECRGFFEYDPLHTSGWSCFLHLRDQGCILLPRSN